MFCLKFILFFSILIISQETDQQKSVFKKVPLYSFFRFHDKTHGATSASLVKSEDFDLPIDSEVKTVAHIFETFSLKGEENNVATLKTILLDKEVVKEEATEELEYFFKKLEVEFPGDQVEDAIGLSGAYFIQPFFRNQIYPVLENLIANEKKAISGAFYTWNNPYLTNFLIKSLHNISGSIKIILDRKDSENSPLRKIKHEKFFLKTNKQLWENNYGRIMPFDTLHHKFFVFEGASKNPIVVSGSYNPTVSSDSNLENIYITNHVGSVKSFATEFNNLWYDYGKDLLAKEKRFEEFESDDPKPIKLSDSTPFIFKPYFGPIKDNLAKELIGIIDAEKKSIRIAAFTFCHSGITYALKRASDRGVDVKALVDKTNFKHGTEYLYALKLLNEATRNNTKYFSGFNMHHNKFMTFEENELVDNLPAVWVGSFNFTGNSANFVWENGSLIGSKEFYDKYQEEWIRNFNLPSSITIKDKVDSAVKFKGISSNGFNQIYQSLKKIEYKN